MNLAPLDSVRSQHIRKTQIIWGGSRAITTATTNIACGGKTGQTVFAYCKEKEMGDDTEDVFKYLEGYCKYSRRIYLR